MGAFYFPSYVFLYLFEFPAILNLQNNYTDRKMMKVLTKRSKCEETYRSCRPEVFSEKGVLRNFAKFTGKHLSQSLFFNKVAGARLTGYLSLYL